MTINEPLIKIFEYALSQEETGKSFFQNSLKRMGIGAAVSAFKRLIEEILAARKEQEERKMTVEEFSLFWLLRKEGINEPEQKAHQMMGVLQKHPHWRQSDAHRRQVKQELYKLFLQSGTTDVKELKKIADRIMIVLERSR
jgi:type I restriction enzyme R subunit